MWLEHILVGMIVVVVPLLTFYGLRKLKGNQVRYGKIKIYLSTIAGLWGITGFIGYISSSNEIFYFNYSIELNWVIKVFLMICFIFFIFTTIVPFILLKNKVFKAKLKESFYERQFIFPTTKLEAYLFGFVAISVGICEEVIFRSFLVKYAYNLPIGLSITASIIIAGIIFGLGHFHQGTNGVVSATVVGFLMSYLFMATGNLLLPIIVHALYDMKILLLLRISITGKSKHKATINDKNLEI